MGMLTVAAVQISCSDEQSENLEKVEYHIRQAASQGAQLVVLQELFEGPYFCIDADESQRARARPFKGHPTLASLAKLARELGVVLPVSFYELAGDSRYNSLCMIDADGEILGLYRKSHIPDYPGYEERTYFSQGDTGFMVFATAAGRIGAGICWDQWFPEAARAMALQGAEILIYPTAIGSDPTEPAYDPCGHWQRVMQGHAGANMTPVIAANRVGVETGKSCEITFFGSSFIADQTGAMLAEADRHSECVVTASFDLAVIAKERREWGIFNDRRHDLYDRLTQPSPPGLQLDN